jgi:hypothetical protein
MGDYWTDDGDFGAGDFEAVGIQQEQNFSRSAVLGTQKRVSRLAMSAMC